MENSQAHVQEMLASARENLVTIAENSNLIEAAKLLSSGTDILVVCDADGVVQGVVTKTDVVRQIGADAGTNHFGQIAAIMTRDVLFCQANDLLHNVSIQMKARHLKNVPVIDGNNRPIGLLTARAILRVLLSEAEYQESQLIDYVKGVGYR